MNADFLQDVVRQVLNEMKLESELLKEPRNFGIFERMEEAVEAAQKAQRLLFACSVQERNAFADAIRAEVLKKDNLEMLSRDTVEETGIGRVEDKIIKNRVAAEKTPRAKNVSVKLVKMINRALEEAGAPKNLVTMVREPSIENTNLMMYNPNIRLLVATGGPGIVHAVLSSGKKAIGAGAENPPVVVDETADIEQAAKDIVAGASFDNNVPCIAEKEVFAVESICDKLIYHMKKNGAYEISSEEMIERLDALVSKEDGKPRTEFVGKSAKYILDKLGIYVEDSIRLIICRTNKNHHLVTEEMLMPILPVVSVSDVDVAIDYAFEAEHGNRHTAIMHSRNVEKLSKMAKLLEATIFVKNAPSYAGIGVGGEGHMTFTIAGPTGEGITSAKSFCRIRRCVMHDAFSIR